MKRVTIADPIWIKNGVVASLKFLLCLYAPPFYFGSELLH